MAGAYVVKKVMALERFTMLRSTIHIHKLRTDIHASNWNK